MTLDLAHGVVTPQSLAEAISDTRGATGLRAQRAGPVRYREISFEREGRVACQDVDPTRSTGDHLAQLLDCLRWHPGALDYAFIGWAQGTRNVWWSDHMHYDLPGGLSEPDVRGFRTLWSSHVPDAFGVQVLTDAHLDRAYDLSDWVIEELAPGRHLVTASNLDPWLTTPPPHPQDEYRLSPRPADILAAARGRLRRHARLPSTRSGTLAPHSALTLSTPATTLYTPACGLVVASRDVRMSYGWGNGWRYPYDV